MATRIFSQTPAKSETREAQQCDYSYCEWRHAQMRQLDQDYNAQCERQMRGQASFAA